MISNLFNTGLSNINNTLRGAMTMNGWGLANPYLMLNGNASFISNSSGLGVIDGLGFINPYFMDPLTIPGPSGLQGNLCGLRVLGGLGALPVELGILSVSDIPAGFINLTGMGDIAGLISLGNSAGLRINGATGITNSLGF